MYFWTSQKNAVKNQTVLALISLAMASCTSGESYLLTEVPATHSGIHFENTLSETPELNILTYLYYYNGSGVMAADFNGDNLPDLYFAGNQVADALYINRGGFTFEEVTDYSGISNATGWTTGVTHADVNGDGLLDIYICKASGYRALSGQNLLYINTGNNADGIPQFTEKANEYGLNFSGLSTQAAFLDFDLDGDLDVFLLNHSVHPNRTYGKGDQREGFDPISGDRLYRNDNGQFIDISADAGIFQGKAGYGLGVGISDVNQDGYPDIYVGNDFFENDYLYLNTGLGSFTEVISLPNSPIGHTTHYSMGNALEDVNNDGLPDIISLDMLPEDLLTYKTSGLEYGFPVYQQYLRNGFAPQYMQNTLQLNLGNGSFSEIGFLSGIAATEWSWGVVAADFNNDSFKDLFITNGIKGATNDMDYMNFIANESIQRRIDQGMTNTDMPLTQEIPSKKATNYIFQNNGDLTFAPKIGSWIKESPSFSHGSAYADLDNDGDLDLIVNPVDATAKVYENKLTGGHYIRVQLRGQRANTNGVGAKVIAHQGKHRILQENHPTRGYLSAVPNELHLGLAAQPDSLTVVWPGGHFQTIPFPPIDSVIEAYEKSASGNYYQTKPSPPVWQWTQIDSVIPFSHQENPTLDFDREPLIVAAGSNQGPEVSVADFNGDGLEDLVIAGGKRQPTALYIQTPEGSFTQLPSDVFDSDSLSEDTALCSADLNGDGWPDLLVGSGGNEFQSGGPIEPRVYMNQNGILAPARPLRSGLYINASGIDVIDRGLDGIPDVLVTADAVPGQYGAQPTHYLLENDGQGNFRDVTDQRFPDLRTFGSISEVTVSDITGDKIPEIILAGWWNAIAIYSLKDKVWTRVTDNGLAQTEGWWTSIKSADLDGDGDQDLVAGNWGLNSKFKASKSEPITLYRYDFDQNGTIDPLVTYYHKGVETPFASKDELSKQLPFLNKKFRTYKSFAQSPLEGLFDKAMLNTAEKKKVYELASCVFINTGDGQFIKQQLPGMAQVAPIFDVEIFDFDKDGYPDLFPVGNLFQISTQLGRLDGLNGLLLQGQGNGEFTWWSEATAPLSGACRQIKSVKLGDRNTFVIVRNNATPVFLTQAPQ